MALRYPLEYDLTPTHVEPGMRWLKLRLRNVGDRDLTSLDVRLNSLDTYSIAVQGMGLFVTALRPQEEHVRAFQVSADMTGRVYVSVDGWQEGEQFHWESPGILVTVGEEVAELVSLYALTEPYPRPGEAIVCEGRVRGVSDSEDLMLEFWARKPDGEFEELTIETLGALAQGDEETYQVEITPEEEGSYTVHAYLYDGARRIGHAVDHVYVGNV
jgi:hypothetical protein